MQEHPKDPPPRWRRIEPYSAVVVALCAAWTLPVLLGAWGPGLEEPLMKAGALRKDLLWEGEYWRLLSATFLHGGWVHLIVNGLSLYLVGSLIARSFGGAFLLVVLLVSAIGGHFASLTWTNGSSTPNPELWDLQTVRVGISGAVFGLLGVILGAEWWRQRGRQAFFKSPTVRTVCFFLLLNAGLGLAFPMIDQWAHAGGFVAGLLYGTAYFWKRGRYPGRALFLCLVLAGAPLAYACAPFRSVRYHLHLANVAERGLIAERARTTEAARSADGGSARKTTKQTELEETLVSRYNTVLELEPNNGRARIRLAVLENDPSHLGSIDDPFANNRLVAQYVAAVRILLTKRALSDPDAARALLQEIQRRRGGQRWMIPLWRTLASGFAAANRLSEAESALENAMAIADDPHAAKQLLSVLVKRLKSDEVDDDARLRVAVRIAEVARIAVGVIEDQTLVQTADDREPHVERYFALIRVLTAELNALRSDPSRRDGMHALAGALADFCLKLGIMLEGGAIESIPPHPRAPSAFYLSVRFRLLSLGEGAEPPDELGPLLKGAIELARELENIRLAEDMGQFGRASGLLRD